MRRIFRFIRHFAFLIIVVTIGYAYLNNSQFQATANEGLWNIHQQTTQLINHYFPTNGSNNNNQRSSSNNHQNSNSNQHNASATDQTEVPTDGRWPTNVASVYVDTGNNELDQATNQAIQAWNQTGAFTFRPTSDRSKADIVVSEMNNGTSGAAGLTRASSNPMTGRLMHADVYLNAHYLMDPAYGYSQQRIVNTAEHELGHAIGLDHTDAVSVMQPAGSFYSIQPRDVQTVQKLYQGS